MLKPQTKYLRRYWQSLMFLVIICSESVLVLSKLLALLTGIWTCPKLVWPRGSPVMLSGRKRGLSPQMRRELKRRSAIEVTIGHMTRRVASANTDGRLDRNFLKGKTGDAINALLVAAGYNMRLILNALAFWLAWIMIALTAATKMAKTDTFQPLNRYQTSMG